MEVYTIILISIGVATDAFAVAVTHGTAAARFRWPEALKMAGLFGLFQAGMPVLGWLIGLSFKDYITSVDHWVAFVLLSLIGLRMIYHDWKADEMSEHLSEETAPKDFLTMLALAVATSIDALVVGITFIVLQSIVFPVVAIGVVTFALCLAGAYLGHRCKHLAGRRVNTFGGAILILIGIKILVEHLSH